MSKCKHHQKNTQSKKTNSTYEWGSSLHTRAQKWDLTMAYVAPSSRLAKACPLAPLLNLFREIASPLTVQCRKSVHRKISTSKDFHPSPEKKSFSAGQKATKQEVTNSKPRANYLSLSCACIIFGSRKWTDAIDL